MRVEPEQIDQLLHPSFDAEAEKAAKLIAKGLPASPGAACGKIFFNAADAEAAVANGDKAILVREETSPNFTIVSTVPRIGTPVASSWSLVSISSWR